MNFSNLHILILEGYARQSLPLSRAAHNLGCEVTVLCKSKIDVSYVSKFVTHKILGVCDRDNPQDTLAQIRELLYSGIYDVVIPTTDFSASLLSENKDELSQYAKIASNNLEVYRLASDKQETMKICMEHQIPCPVTISDVNSIEDILNSNLQYPIVMKPRTGYGAIGFKVVTSQEHLKELVFNVGDQLNKYIFQEYVPQTDIQYECAMFIDQNNQVKTSVVFSKNRWFPVSGGSSTLNITVDRPDIIENCTRLLQVINWRGAADIDLIQDPRDNTAKIMEINPRVSGSVKICFVSGVDQARQMLELAYNQEVTKFATYTLDQRLRCSQIDVLWFLKSPNRWKSNPSWLSVKNTKDQTFSWDDPLPWFAFLISGLRNLNGELKKRG